MQGCRFEPLATPTCVGDETLDVSRDLIEAVFGSE
jgi:hypothetical protein